MRVLFSILLLAIGLQAALAQSLTFVGNTHLFLTGVGELPVRGSFIQPTQSVSVITQTSPISSGQSAVLVYTLDNWRTTKSVPMQFDFNTGSNTQWFAVLGPMRGGSDLQFYIRADVTNGASLFDSNGGQNFAFLSRSAPKNRAGAILQWFSTDYNTILKRLPEVVQAGYGVIYLPPPTKSGSGGLSVGYNPVDRFDLGDRMQFGSLRTRYGTTEELQNLIRVAHRLGLEVFTDLVFNHNDNRGSTAITSYPEQIPEDFHIHSSADTSNSEIDFNNASPFAFGTLNYDIVGLADIAHEDGNQAETGPFTLPSYSSFNIYGKPSFVRHATVPSFYPQRKVVAEDVRQYLRRWGWWLTTQIGFDGYRLDAVRHTPPQFFAKVQTQAGPWSSAVDLLPSLYFWNPNLFIFGEDLTSDAYEQREYIKTGMNLLDFPLKFNLDSLLNSRGFGSVSQALSNGYGLNSATGLPYELGGLATDVGVAFLQSHDGGPPQANNLGYAFLLTRPGSSIVYYDGNNQDPNDYTQFPKPGRFDALGAGGDTMLRLVDARARFGRGFLVNRFQTGNLYVYERQVGGSGVMLVGLNIRGDMTAITATVQTAFAPGTVLKDLSGQQPNVSVAGDGKATIIVPANSAPGIDNNARGYVVYVPLPPAAVAGVEAVSVIQGGSALPFTTFTSPATAWAAGGTYRAVTVTSGKVDLQITTDSVGSTAAIKLDNGVAPPGVTVLSNTPEGLTDRCFLATPTSGAAVEKSRRVEVSSKTFTIQGLDVSHLDPGLHSLKVRVFADTGSRPGVFTDFFCFFNVNPGTFSTIDGVLSEYGSAIATQSRSPSSGGNHIDLLYATNDDQYIYLGVAGQIEPSQGFTNGLAMFLDTDPGSGSGLHDFSQLADDTGPAGRLLSNAQVTAPTGFGAEFAVGSFRGSRLSSAPEATFIGGLATPPAFGAQAGLFRIDMQRLATLRNAASVLSYQPRAGSFGSPPKGVEVAIPISTLFPQFIQSTPSLGLLAYLCTTGETGQVLPPSDPNRAALGGRPAAVSWVANQFLPPQSNINSDPGLNPVSMQSYTTYNLKLAGVAQGGITLNVGAITINGNEGTQTVHLVNGNPFSATGPFYIVVHFNSSTLTLTHATGQSKRESYTAYVKVNQSLGAGADIPVALSYFVPMGLVPAPTFAVKQGIGIP